MRAAPFFSATTGVFRDELAMWQAAGKAAPWPDAGDDVWVGVPSNHAVARHLVGGLEGREGGHFAEEDRAEAPGDDIQSDDELLDFARQRGTTAFHLMGTCRMGPATDPSTVVDDELRVHGMKGLRVADASIMPMMPSSNTNAPTIMIGEKAADMIRNKQPLPSVDVSG